MVYDISSNDGEYIMSMWQIMVPCNYNDGKPVRTKHHKEWDKFVRKHTGGLTIMKPAKGQWVDYSTDKLYEDRVIPVNIIASDNDMKKIAKFTMSHYRQLAVLYFKISSETFIVFASDL